MRSWKLWPSKQGMRPFKSEADHWSMFHIRKNISLRRYANFLAILAACVSLLTACVGISAIELQSIGSKVTPENINFGELYTYAERRTPPMRRNLLSAQNIH